MKTINTLVLKIALVCLSVLLSQAINALPAQALTNCVGTSCFYTVCNSDTDCGSSRFSGQQWCQSNNLYQNYVAYVCNNPGSRNSNCTSSKTAQIVQICPQKCESDIWYIGCSTGTTSTGTGTTGIGNPVYPGNPIYTGGTGNTSYISHYTKGCIENSSHWYDSLGNENGIYQNCGTSGKTCSNGECIGGGTVVQSSYKAHVTTKCSSDNLYWYDSNGTINTLSKSCTDSNQCTIDTCSGTDCQNTLRCDGSTCGVSSADYAKYCAGVCPKVIASTGSETAENSNQSSLTAALSGSALAGFFKKWLLWIIIVAILLFLFVVIFRRLSHSV